MTFAEHAAPVLLTWNKVRVVTRRPSALTDHLNHGFREPQVWAAWVLRLGADLAPCEELVAELQALIPPRP